MNNLFEDSRSELVSRARHAAKEKDGKTRYEKRVKSRVSSSTKTYNRIDMDKFFKEDILTVYVEVRGETDNYLVGISYSSILEELQKEVARNSDPDKLELRNIIRALVIAFNRGDVYIRCSCPDWKYRFHFWASKNDLTFGEKELRPSDETNPSDELGPACKHVLCVLSNTSWIIKIASVINNYIHYMELHYDRLYKEKMYPKIYGHEYTEPVQQDMFDDELVSDQDTIDKSNEYARTKTQFKPGNKYRYTKSEEDPNQIGMFDDEESNEEGE